MRWLRLSLFAQAILALYFQVIQWLPLGSWNYQPEHSGLTPFSNLPLSVLAVQGRLTAQAALLVIGCVLPFAIFWFAYFRGLRWLMWMQVGFYSVWMAVEMSWWVLYAIGRSDSEVQRYQRIFGLSTQLLPSFGRHLPPDGVHLVLHILLAAVLVSAVVGLLKPSSQAPSE